MKDKLSLSLTNGKVSERHSRRWYVPASADASLSTRNIRVVDPTDDAGNPVTYRAQINEMFAPAILRYNDKQKRLSRMKSFDYYGELVDGKRKEKPVYSTIVQIGNRDTCGVTDMAFDAKTWRQLREYDEAAASEYVKRHLVDDVRRHRVKATLLEVCERWQTWYPNLRVVSAIIHDDEPSGTMHADINWVPVAGGEGSQAFKAGMDMRISLNRALKEMGITGRGFSYPIKEWQADAKAKIESVMHEYGIEREHMGNVERHKDTATYVMEQERERMALECKEMRRRAQVAEERAARAEYEASEALRAKLLAEDELDELVVEIQKMKAEKERLAVQLNGVKEQYQRSAKARALRDAGKQVPLKERPVSELFVNK